MTRMRGFRLILVCLAVLSSPASSQAPYTSQPIAALVQRAVHSLFPLREFDEAFEANAQGRLPASDLQRLIAGAEDDYFQEMDYGVTKDGDALAKLLGTYIPGISKADAVRRAARGRNNWIVWTGGNDRFWTYMTQATLGSLDFLKTISNHPSLPANRDTRWRELGLVNEPCFEKPAGARTDRYGLYLDQRSSGCAPDPFEDKTKYPGVKVGWRGKQGQVGGKTVTFDDGSFYGYATGVVGLRLFPNPEFGPEAAAKWDANKYYTDPSYYNDPKLIRPYRVGMSCGFCHVGPNPSKPPADHNRPKWENLSSNVGAQYYWVDRIFNWDYKRTEDSFVFQLLHTARPGTLDTSLISSDQINNPRTMNAIYDLPARVAVAGKLGHRELLSGDEMRNAQFNAASEQSVPKSSPLRTLFDPAAKTSVSLRVLKDGADSVGVLGALNRVYVNIGLFSEEWVMNFIPVVGGSKIEPFKIETAEKKSLYWKATANQTPDLALFLLAASRPDKLASAPGVPTGYLKAYDSPPVVAGKKAFARNCAGCHSSKLPDKAYQIWSASPSSCIGKGYMDCWNRYWTYVKTDEFKAAMEAIALKDDFLKDNYLSTDLRVPVNLVQSQLCSPIGTNAIKANIWDNFSSTSYKNLPSVGKYRVNYPADAADALANEDVDVPGGGRGFLRVPSLLSLWSTAPFLQNNTLGKFDWRGTVEGRLSSFDDSIRKLLDPDLRAQNPLPGQKAVSYVTASGGPKIPGLMDVTTSESYLKIPKGYLPGFVRKVLSLRDMFVKGKGSCAGSAPDDGHHARIAECEMNDYVMLGPIPAGVPVNLIANLDLGTNISALEWLPHKLRLAAALEALVEAVLKIRQGKLKGEEARKVFMQKAAGPLIKANKCKEFVVNRGHYFGTKYGSAPLSPEDKTGLIEFLKHF